MDLVERRLLREETIPHQEKVFSLFEPHTQWIAKGKLFPPVELGHPLLITTDQHELILDYQRLDSWPEVGAAIPVLSRNSNGENSCGFAIIVAEKASESLAGTNGADIWKLREFWLDDLVLQTLVVSLGVIMQNEFTNNAT